MRMTSWFESVRRQFGSVNGAKSRRHWSGETRRLTPTFVESLEDRCLLAAGDLDPSFGVGGKVTTAFQGDAKGNSLAVQSDGKLVVAGYTYNGTNYDFALARYNTDGTLDTSFDGDGKLTTNFVKNDYANSVAVQTDGKIVVAGYVNSNGDFYDFALTRYNSNGTLDTSFAVAGKLKTDIGIPDSFERGNDTATSMALQADGKIVVAGYTLLYGYNRVEFALVRYTTDGVLDSSFDGDGKLTTPFNGSDYATSVVVQADGQIVVAGYAAFVDFALVRYNRDGSLDTSFDGDGKLTTNFGGNDYAQSVAVQTDGKIVVAGYTDNAGRDFALVRYNRDGSLDTSFDGDGKLTTNFGGNDYAQGLAVQRDGKIIVAGYTDNGGRDFALARYNSNGSLSTSFNGDGKLTTEFFGYDDRATSVVLQADDKIVVAGYSFNGTQYVFALARYANSAIDAPPTFTSANTVIVQENTTAVNTVAATDPEGGSLIYSLDGGADVALFDVDPTSGVLVFKAARDFENPIDADHNNIYLVMVQASDGTNLVQQTVAVTVTDTNEPPTITSANSVSVLDNTTDVLTIVATDPESALLTYSLSGGADVALFVVDPTSGVLVFKAARDFDNPTDADHDNVYEVEVAAIDGANLVRQTVSVDVANANEAPTITSPNSVSVAENSTAVMTVAATDPEQDKLTFSLSGGDDQASFNIDSASGALSLKSAPDFEIPADANHDNSYSLQIQVSDGTDIVTQNLNIVVTNVDESPTITSANSDSIAENTSFVVTVTGNDPEGHLPHFGITGGADQAKFTLNFLTGALSFVSPPDFEHPTDANHDNVYEVQVAVSDGTHLVTQDVSVTVTNVNETVAIPLPVSGGTFKSLFLNGQLHLRNSAGRELIAPIILANGADVRFNGSNAADRLTLDRSWSRFAGSLTFNGNGGNDQLDARAVSVDVAFNGGDGNDTFIGGLGDDTANGGAGLDSLSGGDGYDSLIGGDGNDRLTGDGGEDSLSGGAGTDSINGGEGDDSISGGDANDTLFGDAGSDTITGDAGADSINGGNDDDVLLGNAGNDTIDGGTGDDVIDGGDDNDNLKGSDGDDAIRGGNGNDTLSGGNGNDLLTGSAGNDSLKGDAGTDTLLGDAGNDTLNGGLDIDRINGILTGPSKDTLNDSTKVIDTSFTFDFDALLADLL